MKYAIARALLLPLALGAAILMFGTSLALADGGAAAATTGPDSPQSLAALWPMLAVGLSSLFGLLVPRLSAEFTFFHSARGKILLTVLGAFASSIPSAMQAHGLCWAMLAWAALGAVGTLTSALDTKKTVPGGVGMILPLLLLPALLCTGCSWEPLQAPSLSIGLVGAGVAVALLVARALALRSAVLRRGAVALALLSAFMALPGCATVATPPNATVLQKLQADNAALHQIAADAVSKCGPEFAPFAPLIAAALAVAADVYNVVADIMALVGAIPAIAQDIKGIQCVVQVIRDDFNALKPKPGTSAARAAYMADLVIVKLQHAIDAGDASLLAMCTP